ncbi:MAG: hypothetical protein FI702_09850 [SAR202 cluster bacterium]|nr:hypothetical protein [SAR202 cluster bacterium]
MELAYRTDLISGYPDAADDIHFHNGVVEASAYWLIMALGWYLKRVITSDPDWGISIVRQRIMVRLGAFVDVSEHYEYLPTLSAFARSLFHKLGARWPVETRELPLYPAFR